MTLERSDNYEGLDGRIRTVALTLALAFLVLGARLWELQVHRGAEFSGKSDRNSLRIQRLEAPRGTIVGHDGVVLADNRPARDLMFVPADCDVAPEIVCRRLEEILGIDAAALMEEIEEAIATKQPHKQILIRRDVPSSISARVDEYAYALPGVFTVVRPIRRYAYGKTAGQLLGYLGEINKSELELQNLGEIDKSELQHSEFPYQLGDLIGRSGLERRYEKTLRGKEGKMMVTRYAVGVPQIRTDLHGQPHVENLVDSYGHNLRVESEIREPIPGKQLDITLDIALQAKAEELLDGEEGAIVLLNADTGALLALASSPGYDPSIFVTRSGNRKRIEALTEKPNRMIHRAYQEVYAPGSVFKLLLAAAALEEGIIDPSTTHYCPGKFRITPTGRTWHCWKRYGHGEVNVVDALAYSCDVFFYNVGLKLGVDKIHRWAERAGLGRKTGLDLPGEVPGLVPSRQWKEDLLRPAHRNEPWEYRWYPGDTVNLAIGQGATATTPLQNAILMAAIVNGGRRVQPYVNSKSKVTISEPLVSEHTLEIVRRGLRKCVEKGPPAPTGTGHRAYIEGFDIIGKTGSSQNVSLSQHEKYESEEDIPKELRDHAWFVAGVLDREPRIALCVLVEHGHHGSSVAAPLAKTLIEFFYASRGSTPGLKVAREVGGMSP